jgi:hypothetical protein
LDGAPDGHDQGQRAVQAEDEDSAEGAESAATAEEVVMSEDDEDRIERLLVGVEEAIRILTCQS